MQQTEIDFNWPPEKVRKSTPEQLFNLIDGYANYIKEKIRTNRLVLNDEQWVTFQHEILVEWGRWSHAFNKILRQMIKECDLFKDTPMRIKGKKLSTCHLYWTKWTRHMEAIVHNNVFLHMVYISHTIGEIKEVKTYFENIDKMEIVMQPKLRAMEYFIKKENEDEKDPDAGDAPGSD